jgi:hypothetical protein
MALEAWDKLVAVVKTLTTPADTQPADLRRGQTILLAPISIAASGDNTVIAADATKKIKVLSYVLVSTGTVNATWKSGAAVNLSGSIPLVADTGVAVGGGNAPGTHWELETVAAQALVINLTGNVGVGGHLSYFIEA